MIYIFKFHKSFFKFEFLILKPSSTTRNLIISGHIISGKRIMATNNTLVAAKFTSGL